VAHPNGGSGGRFSTKHGFSETRAFIGTEGVSFPWATEETTRATQGFARDGLKPTIVFLGEKNRHGSACPARWGFRIGCNQSRIGQCAETLVGIVARKQHAQSGGFFTRFFWLPARFSFSSCFRKSPVETLNILRTALSKRSAWVSRGMCGGGAGFIFYTAMFRPSHRSSGSFESNLFR